MDSGKRKEDEGRPGSVNLFLPLPSYFLTHLIPSYHYTRIIPIDHTYWCIWISCNKEKVLEREVEPRVVRGGNVGLSCDDWYEKNV